MCNNICMYSKIAPLMQICLANQMLKNAVVQEVNLINMINDEDELIETK